MLEWLGSRWKLIALVAVALVILPPLSNSVVGGGQDLKLAANAPEKDGSLHLLLAVDPGVFGSCSDDAQVEIEYNDLTVFPIRLGDMEVDDCRGTLSIPYNQFASANGQYIVRAHYDGKTVEEPVFVKKYVNWVYVRAFDEEDKQRTRIDVAFDAQRAQPLTSSIFSTGTLELTVRWEQCSDHGPLGLPINPDPDSCGADGQLAFYAEIPVDNRASTHVFIPWENLNTDTNEDGQPEEGWYNVTATFHNDAAKANYNVPQDPSVYQENPPGNWFEVDYR